MTSQRINFIKIMIADDHGIVRNGLRRILEDEEDMEVVGEVSDGRECLQEVDRINPDIILMDISMPELNGIETTRIIRERYPKIKVLILSMHHSAEYVYRTLKAGAIGYILKQSLGSEVIEAIRTIHTGKPYLSMKITGVVIEDYVSNRQIADNESRLDKLSVREREILQLVVEGYSNRRIAEIVSLSIKTVETYRHRFMEKLSISNIPDLTRFAIKHGIISLE